VVVLARCRRSSRLPSWPNILHIWRWGTNEYWGKMHQYSIWAHILKIHWTRNHFLLNPLLQSYFLVLYFGINCFIVFMLFKRKHIL